MHVEERDINCEKLLDEVLTKEPGFFLSAEFVDKVLAEVEKRQTWTQYVREFFVYLGAFCGIAILLAGMVLIWFQENLDEWLLFMASHVSWVVGINVILVFVLFADRVLLPYHLDRQKELHSNLI